MVVFNVYHDEHRPPISLRPRLSVLDFALLTTVTIKLIFNNAQKLPSLRLPVQTP